VDQRRPGADPIDPEHETGPARVTGGREVVPASGLALRWAHLMAMREARLALPPPDRSATLTSRSAAVPWGVDVAASWAWRFLVIIAAGAVIAYVVSYLALVVLPIVVALFITALGIPVVDLLARRLPRALAAILVVLVGLAFVGALLTFAGQQVVNGATDLADQTSQGLGEIRDWLRDGPLRASDSQINGYIEQAQSSVNNYAKDGGALSQVTEIGTTITHVFAGFFIVLFSTFFFLSDGARIWAWIVRLSPRAARGQVDSSGRVAWISMTQFVRATVIVAAVDAIGIMVVAAVLRVPFVLAIGVLVFLGSFVPLIGATIAGSVAVLVALVDQGPITALLMLAGVVLVQQIEGHVLQPFLMGRWVSIHPLGIIFSLAIGVLVAGVAGALVAVPLAAAVNAVGQHLASNTSVGDEDPVEELNEDYDRLGGPPDLAPGTPA